VRKLFLALLVALAAWTAWGLSLRGSRAPRGSAPAGELRGAWHVHTTASHDGRAPLPAVVRAAREAGLQFLVVTEHDGLAPAAPEWRDGVLVIPGTEISSPVGHVVAVGLPRALTPEEKSGDPFDAIAALGGRAVVPHPLHPRRPFKGDWGDPRIAGMEPVSNDSFWGGTLARQRVGAFLAAVLAAPWDGARAVLALYDEPVDELRRLDALARERPVALLCSADAHGYPSYLAAFEAFSMHVPVTPTGDAARDARAVLDALLGGRAICVFDAVAPGWTAALSREEGPGGEALVLRAPPVGAEVRVFHDGKLVRAVPQDTAGAVALCGAGAPRCERGSWRAEARLEGRPWIFTNPAPIR
jgi:hypothetical protein